MWDRLHAALTHMAERLEDAPDGGRKIFRDTLFEVPVELCGLLTRLNVNKDPKLEEARKLLESTVCNVGVKDVRESDGARVEVRTNVNEILKRFDF